MGYWGKVFGGVAGFAMAGPFGAAIGAALGHAADSGLGPKLPFPFASQTNTIAGQAKVAALLGRKDQLFSIAAVVLSPNEFDRLNAQPRFISAVQQGLIDEQDGRVYR